MFNLLTSSAIFFFFLRLAMAQAQNRAAQSAEINNSLSPGNSNLSTNEAAGFSGANQVTSPSLGIAAETGPAQPVEVNNSPSPGNSNEAAGFSGANQETSPPSGIAAEPGLAAPESEAANREAGQKKWLLLYNFTTGITYDDNIFISHQNKQADEVFTVSGELTLGLGDFRDLHENYLLAQYLLGGFFYVHNSQKDSPEQELALRTQFRFSKLTLQTQTQYEFLNAANRQVGNFVSHILIDNLVRLAYDYSDKTRFFLSFEQITDLYRNYLSSYEYIGRSGGEYQITPKVKLGGEAVLGTLHQEASPSGTFAQLRLLAAYGLTGKLSFQLSAGGEIRHYESDGGLTRGTPVFSLGLTYHPFLDTSVGLSGYRNVNASISAAGENFVATGVTVQLNQSLFRRVTVGTNAGYENDRYLATQAGAAESGRVDNYFFIQSALTYRFRNWLSASVSYEFRRNASNESNFTFSDNRVAISAGANF
jgi:Putative beta-barrel porin 2